MNENRIIIGCGYVGQRLAHAEMSAKNQLKAFVTHEDKAQRLSQEGINCAVLDLDDNTNVSLPNLRNTVVHYHVPPTPSGKVDLRIKHFINLLDQQPSAQHPKRIVLISTTGVYGNANGEWVSETAPTNPQTDRAQRRVDAEQQLSTWCQQHNIERVILRVPGIYGPGRTPEARLSNPVININEAPFSNRIHVDDLVTACLRAASINTPQAVYNINDNQPSTMTDYFNAVADHAKLPRPRAISIEQAKIELSAGMLSYLSESRRIDNTLMSEHLGVHLRFPTLASGLSHCFQNKGRSN
ncbi:MAG: SDR family oxidoreductase [Thiotrichales bacterium]|nr:SDR family oxidoreductase [Thiotrichales bacterium]